VLTTFADLEKQTARLPARTVALVIAQDARLQEAAFKLESDNLLRTLFIGDRAAIQEAAARLGRLIPEEHIFEASNPANAASLAVKIAREGKADFLMKGKLETAELLRPVVNRETGLFRGAVMSHVALFEVPAYRKLLAVTDGGMLPYPTLEQKKGIIRNAVGLLHAIGYENPKVCILAATEKINQKMPETMEAALLKDMANSGELGDCTAEGPISLDLALTKERSGDKGYASPCAGDADLLVVPNIHAGNILGKCLVEMAKAKMAGLVVGAQCPIALASRGSSAEELRRSLLLARAVCGM